jgi:DNA helicase-2/ATP-dependent DNA helicase PcrA
MSLSIVSSEKIDEENKIQENIFEAIDKNENIIFSSGAGSGKTYSLIESLKYIINKHGLRLKEHNQNIICITYTNVATEEVKERLGNSDLVKVSTIHERIWELIKDYQNELVVIHQAKLVEEINLLNYKLINDDKFGKFQALTEAQKISFTELMISKKDIFYKSHDDNAGAFRNIFKDLLHNYPDIVKNVAHFKSLVNTIYTVENYTSCLRYIDTNKKGYNKVVYNAAYNIDQLHWMRISHDTLLEYGLNIIKKYKPLQQIIIDKYPYFLIDEYQDTDKQVIEIMSLLSKYSGEIKHEFFCGYFGDPAQNIYDTGVGKNIKEFHPNLKNINKLFNRRSTKEVIEVINTIRNDDIVQESIYDDSSGGSVKFYTGNKDESDSFIEKHIKEWNISIENKLHCFVLTNKSVAAYSGFSNVYSFFANTKKYKVGLGYKQINTELLSDDKSKLSEIPILLFRILEFRNKLLQKGTSVNEIIDLDIYGDMDIGSLRKFIDLVKEIDGTTLGEFINKIKQTYDETDSVKYQLLINKIFDFEGFPSKSFVSYILECLYPNIKDEELDQAETTIDDFLNINLNEFNLWYKYILKEVDSEIVYHTYHGTKGLEYDNVIILMENAFGTNRKYFNSYFMELASKREIPEAYIEKFEQTKNLLYVACSRAIKNLRVLYLDDISEFKDGVEEIFSKVEH